MITQDSQEKQIKDINESTLRLKTSQPFFYGQLSMKQSVSDGNYYITIGVSSMSMKLTFTANTQENPFCLLYATAGINGNFERHDVISLTPDSVSNSIVSSGKTVSTILHMSHDYSVFNVTVQIIAYAIASDYGTVTVEAA